MSQPIVDSVNTKYISLVPENGEQFNPGQKIIFNIEPNIGFMKRDSYMIFDLLNTTPDFCRVGLNALAGIHSIIENIRIYSKETGVLLESCENYGQIQALINQYGFDDKENIVGKEGVGVPTIATYNNLGGTQSSSLLESSEIVNQRFSPVNASGQPKYANTRYIMSLRCGIFRYFDAERLIPILNFGGLRIEINLQLPDLVLQKLSCDSVSASSAGGGTGFIKEDIGPASVGGALLLAQAAGAGANQSVGISLQPSIDTCGFAVGNTVQLRGTFAAGGAQDITRTITAMSHAGTETTITLSGAGWNDINNNNSNLRAVPASINYQVSNVMFRVCQVVPTAQQASDLRQSLNYEFTTYDLFLDNIPTASMRHQVPINSVASKALAIMSIPYDSSQERNMSNPQYYSGVSPTYSGINSLQFFINNRLYPLRNYNPNHLGDRVLCLNETVKAMKAVGISPLCLGRNINSDLENYNQTFILSRELARNGFVFDLRNAEAEIRLGFAAVPESTVARTNVLRVNTFVFSKKIIETTETGVQVIL